MDPNINWIEIHITPEHLIDGSTTSIDTLNTNNPLSYRYIDEIKKKELNIE